MSLVPSKREMGRSYCWDDFVQLEEDDVRELVDGSYVEIEMPNKWHEKIVALLAYYLQGWVLPRDAGHVLGSGYKIRVSERRGVMPDVQVLSNETWARASEKGLSDGRPELAVEIVLVTSRSYDRVTKLQWYALLGVPEYWIVDPEARTVERLVLDRGRYAIAQTARDDEVFRPESFVELEIPLAHLWSATIEPESDEHSGAG